MSRTATVAKSLLFLSAFAIGGMAVFGLTSPSTQSGVFQQMLKNLPWAGYSHILFGSLALMLGSFQISSRLRRKNIRLHERIGKAYVACVLIASVGAIATNIVSPTPWSAKSAFWLIAIVWPITTLAGYPFGNKRFDPKRHGRWMLWSFALTCSAITLRAILIPQIIFGIPFATAYPISAWTGFSVNLLVLELVLFVKRKRQTPALANSRFAQQPMEIERQLQTAGESISPVRM